MEHLLLLWFDISWRWEHIFRAGTGVEPCSLGELSVVNALRSVFSVQGAAIQVWQSSALDASRHAVS